VISGVFTVGTIVAFSAYLVSLYGSVQGLANAPVDFASSMVSFERVFEVLDLPQEIEEKPDAVVLETVKGEIRFENVTFAYEAGDEQFLSDVHRYGSVESVPTTLSEGGREQDEEHRSQARGNALEEVSFVLRRGS